MQTQLQTCLFLKNQTIYLPLFGYASKSVPGLEINGLGKTSKNIKEKIIYLSKEWKLKTPQKKFVLCLDQQMGIEDSSIKTYQNLELPLLLMYLYLSGNLPMARLDNCFASGTIAPSGEMHDMLPKYVPENFILLELMRSNQHTNSQRLDLYEVLNTIRSKALGQGQYTYQNYSPTSSYNFGDH